MTEPFDRRTTLLMHSRDYERVEALAAEHARKSAEILRAAIVLGCEVIEKQGDKAIKRALAGGGEDA